MPERLGGSVRSKQLRAVAKRVARRILRERDDVVAIAIVGSVARGEAAPGSDLDMAVVVRGGQGKHLEVVHDEALISIHFWPRSEFERHFTEPSAWLSSRHGGLRAEILYDPRSLFPKVRARVARISDGVSRESARLALTGMYEYRGKLRNAHRRRDHANLVYAAWSVGLTAIHLVALLNRRAYTSENTLWTEWRSFPYLPPRFAELVTIACGFRRVSDRELVRATESLWRTCSRWAGLRGIGLPVVRSVASIEIPGRKTT